MITADGKHSLMDACNELPHNISPYPYPCAQFAEIAISSVTSLDGASMRYSTLCRIIWVSWSNVAPKSHHVVFQRQRRTTEKAITTKTWRQKFCWPPLRNRFQKEASSLDRRNRRSTLTAIFSWDVGILFSLKWRCFFSSYPSEISLEIPYKNFYKNALIFYRNLKMCSSMIRTRSAPQLSVVYCWTVPQLLIESCKSTIFTFPYCGPSIKKNSMYKCTINFRNVKFLGVPEIELQLTYLHIFICATHVK